MSAPATELGIDLRTASVRPTFTLIEGDNQEKNPQNKRTIIPVSEIFPIGEGKAGDFFAAIGREPNKGSRTLAIGETDIKVNSEKFGIVSFRDNSDPERPIKKSLTYSAVQKTEDGVVFLLPPEVDAENNTSMSVVEITASEAKMRPATVGEKLVGPREKRPKLVAEPSHDINHPVFWLEKLHAAK